jgi:hypothetical protein
VTVSSPQLRAEAAAAVASGVRDGSIIVCAVESDGLGSFRAKCLGCRWTGTWHQPHQHKGNAAAREARAAADARGHVAHLEPTS